MESTPSSCSRSSQRLAKKKLLKNTNMPVSRSPRTSSITPATTSDSLNKSVINEQAPIPIESDPSPSSSHISTRPNQEPSQDLGDSPPQLMELSQVTNDFNKKLEKMQAHFMSQMNSIQSLVISNNQQIQSKVAELQNEIRHNSLPLQQRPPMSSQGEFANPTPHNFIYSSAPVSLPVSLPIIATASPLSHLSPPFEPALPHIPPNSAESLANDQTVLYRHNKIYPLPKFSGIPEEWQTFIEAFISTTKAFDYSSLHNIMRLREALHGSARETVESLLSHPQNVDAILKTLEETYGRPEQLIKSQIQKVRFIAAVSEGDLSSLIKFANKISNMATFLLSAKGEHHLSNPTLLSELVAKLPISKQLKWAENCLVLGKCPTIMDFSNWLCNLRKLAHMVADALPPSSAIAQSKCSQSNQQRGERQPRNSNNKDNKFACVSVNQKRCLICDGECQSIATCKSFLNLSVEQRWAKVKSLRVCFSCLKYGHQMLKCFSKHRCGKDGCPHFHHQVLHSKIASETPPKVVDVPTSITHEHGSCLLDSNPDNDYVLFQIIPVVLYGKEKTIKIYAFVDDGANATILDAEIMHELGITGEKDVLQLQWINSQTTREYTTKVQLIISGIENNAERFKMTNVFVSSNLVLPIQSFNIDKSSKKYEGLLDGLPIKSYENVQPKMIISLTHAFLTVPIETPRSLPSPGPIVTKTRLGYMVYGPMIEGMRQQKHISCHASKQINEHQLENMESMMKSYFDIETFGIKAGVKPLRSKNEQRALSILASTTRRCGERFESGLLWRDDFLSFPDSFELAFRRMLGVERKISQDTELAKEYCDKIEEYVKKGYARQLTTEEAENRTAKTFYLPHFPIKNINKKKIRLVFDAAAEVQNISLNKALLSGPDINQPLMSILLKFRQAPVAICGDLKEMFHQVSIVKEDQDAQRFLWRGASPKNSLKTYVMERMIFGDTCSPTIAQYVKNSNAQFFETVYPRAVKGIIERHYVDDYVDCFGSEDEAIKVLKEVIHIHKIGGFEMHNFASNSKRVKEELGITAFNESVNVEGEKVDRILGMHWQSNTDEFMFPLKFQKIPSEILSFDRKPTKRELLSVAMSVFDPFGLLANFMICAKILMQQACKAGIEWDQELPEDIFKKWKYWLEELPHVAKFRIQRCYLPRFLEADVELHLFCDESEEALAAVAYWRIFQSDGVTTAFIAGKTACAPTRFHTIPKLELQAALMAVRLKDMIVKYQDIKVKKATFWCDSHTVIRWIRSDHRVYKQYVANRVAEILESSEIGDWRWCPGELNPADDATRAKFPRKYIPDNRWKLGPQFLLTSEQDWPSEEIMKTKPESSSEELRQKHFSCFVHKNNAILLQINRFSNYKRLKRAIAWVFRYVSNLKLKIKSICLTKGELISEEEEKAEFYLCRCVQRDVFSCEYTSSMNKERISISSSLVMLNPIMDEHGIMRVNGRIEEATFLPISTRRPIILPKDHNLTHLIVDTFHRKLRHLNSSTVINEIRQRFWIPAIRRVVRSIEANCKFCKIRKAKPTQPQMGCLPIDRVTPFVRPFSYTGIDFFGPFTVTIHRRHEKRWLALFTCLTVRAVHLEIASDLSSDACILCIRNFINRRGVPLQIRSDNGTNFVGIRKELRGVKDFLDHDKITAGLAPLGITWKFNTPWNPSAGGAWERLVQSVKKVLVIILKEHAPRLDTFYSVLVEAENIVNSRPLTHLPVSPDEPDPLTPNHFLLGCTNSTQTPAPCELKNLSLRKQWRILQSMKDGFWNRWIREYLPDLTRRTKWCLPTRPVSVGCLVLICDNTMARSQWKRGRIVKLNYSKDGIPRSAQVNTNAGIVKRPICKLAILDMEP